MGSGAGGGRERGAVEDPRGFVADLLKDAPDGALVLRHAFLAGRIRRLADAGDEGERAVERADDFADADAIRRSPELIAAVRALLALDQAAVLEVEEDVLEELLRDPFLFGEVANQNGAVAVLL